MVQLFSDEEIKDAKYGNPDLSRLLNIFHEPTEKPHARLLVSMPSEVKILCSLWKQFNTVDGMLYKVGKTNVRSLETGNPKINTN